jgi:hypothetical protein
MCKVEAGGSKEGQKRGLVRDVIDWDQSSRDETR